MADGGQSCWQEPWLSHNQIQNSSFDENSFADLPAIEKSVNGCVPQGSFNDGVFDGIRTYDDGSARLSIDLNSDFH